jgi:transcriptional regulator with XRE-family HTH domain
MQSREVDGGRLRAKREERELTVVQLAALVSIERDGRPVNPSTIHKLESGARQPSAALFGAICRALRCAKADLLASDRPEKASA